MIKEVNFRIAKIRSITFEQLLEYLSLNSAHYRSSSSAEKDGLKVSNSGYRAITISGSLVTLFSLLFRRPSEFSEFLTLSEFNILVKKISSTFKTSSKEIKVTGTIRLGFTLETPDLEEKIDDSQTIILNDPLNYYKSLGKTPENKCDGIVIPEFYFNYPYPKDGVAVPCTIKVDLIYDESSYGKGQLRRLLKLQYLTLNDLIKRDVWDIVFGHLLAHFELLKNSHNHKSYSKLENLKEFLDYILSQEGLEHEAISGLEGFRESSEHLHQIIKKLMIINYLKGINSFKIPNAQRSSINLSERLRISEARLFNCKADIQEIGNSEMKRIYEKHISSEEVVVPVELSTKEELVKDYKIPSSLIDEIVIIGKAKPYCLKGKDYSKYYCREQILKGIESILDVQFNVKPYLRKAKKIADEKRKYVR